MSSLEVDYYSAELGTSCDSLMADVPLVPAVALDSILSAVFPVDESYLDTVCSLLLNNGEIISTNKSDRWGCFPTDPRTSSAHETIAFAPLTSIWDSILSSTTLHPELSLVMGGDSALHSLRGKMSRPDGYFHLTNRSFPGLGRDAWVDVVMPMEFKKKRGSRNETDNLKKVVWSMHEIMRTDPRRRFVTGLTIEDTNVKLWFHDRCSLVASQYIDIHKNWRKLVHVLLALASCSYVDLGFDRQCSVVAGLDGACQFDFTFGNGETYRTVEMISDVGTHNLIGNGTRVWKVQQLDPDGKPEPRFYVLKDTWERSGRDAEHDIVQDIRKKQPYASRHFLTTVIAEFVMVERDGSCIEDDTALSIRRGHNFELTTAAYSPISTKTYLDKPPSSSMHSSPTTPSHPPLPEIAKKPGHATNEFHRRHYRMIIKEVGVSLFYTLDFQKAFLALQGGLIGLHAGHLSGYVHRDVSAGNIMYYDGVEDGLGARGIIMDWEYAKKPDSNARSRDVKTGTAAFMAVEVSTMDYRHIPPRDLRDPFESYEEITQSMTTLSVAPETIAIDQDTSITAAPRISPDNALDEDRKAEGTKIITTFNTSTNAVPVFRQNFLHDYESCWWIAVYLIFTYFPRDRLRTNEFAINHGRIFHSSGFERLQIVRGDLGRAYSSHLDEKAELRCLEILQYWNRKLVEFYKSSYSAGDYWIIKPSLVVEIYELEQKYISGLKDAVKAYPEHVVHYSKLDFEPTLPAEEASTTDSALLPSAPGSNLYIFAPTRK